MLHPLVAGWDVDQKAERGYQGVRQRPLWNKEQGGGGWKVADDWEEESVTVVE